MIPLPQFVRRFLRPLLAAAALAACLVLCVLVQRFEWLDPYLQLVLVYLGIMGRQDGIPLP